MIQARVRVCRFGGAPWLALALWYGHLGLGELPWAPGASPDVQDYLLLGLCLSFPPFPALAFPVSTKVSSFFLSLLPLQLQLHLTLAATFFVLRC